MSKRTEHKFGDLGFAGDPRLTFCHITWKPIEQRRMHTTKRTVRLQRGGKKRKRATSKPLVGK